MNNHKNERRTAYGRVLLVKHVAGEYLRQIDVAKAQDINVRSGYKRFRRFRQ